MIHKGSKFENLYFTLGVEPLYEKVLVMGITDDAKEIPDIEKAKYDGEPCTYIRSFDFLDKEGIKLCFEWLKSCGIVAKEAQNILQQIANTTYFLPCFFLSQEPQGEVGLAE